jgi:predicted metal-dependent enzyme (double-stranded beta helix superfamily)
VSATETFVNQCLAALGEDRPTIAVKEVVGEAIKDKRLDAELSEKPGVRVLHCTDDLTVVHVVIPTRVPRSLPHDHRMWAVVGISRGRENNEFFRRTDRALTASGGRSLNEGEVLAMGSGVIHAVGNPLSHGFTSALHVYGGDLVNVERSMWCEPYWHEERYDALRATGTTFAPV